MRFVFRLVFLGIFFAGTMNGIVACGGGSKTCTNDDGCTNEEVCCKEAGKAEGTCTAKGECKNNCETPCQSKDDCKNNETCKDGCCRSETTCATAACQTATDCTNNQACQNGCCVDNGGKCTKVDDCQSGQECVGAIGDGVCQACSQTCGSDLDCSGGNGISCYRGCCRRPPCKNNDGCTGNTGKTVCDPNSGRCVECAKNDDCQAIRTICDTKTFSCKKVECTDDADCPSARPVCNMDTNKCEEQPVCRKDTDCTDVQLSRCDPKADNGKGACKKGHCVPCTSDDECGTPDDYCVTTSQGLKDGRKCLKGCKTNSDCDTGFDCEEKVGDNYIVGKGIFVCFPRIQYCENPCLSKQCNPQTEFCNLEKGGICELKPIACKPCSSDDECNEPGQSGAKCLQLGGKGFCGQACSTKDDCPKDQKSKNGDAREFACVGSQCTALDSCN